MTTTVSEDGPGSRLDFLRLTGVAFGLGLCANVLFVRQPLGLSVPLFVGLCLLALLALAALERVNPAWRNLWLAGPCLYFATLAAVRAEPLTTLLNLGAVLLLAGLLVHLFAGGRLAAFSLLDYLNGGVITGLEVSLLRPIRSFEAAWRAARHPGQASPGLFAIVRGFALAVPVVAIFTMLLTSADAAFNQYVLEALKFFRLNDLSGVFERLFVTGAMTWICLGGLAYALRDEASRLSLGVVNLGGVNYAVRDSVSRSSTALSPTPPLAFLGFSETAIVLGSVDLLFAAFVAVQFRYFFGGQSNITVAGFTYAEYARRGFAELVVVALFTLGLGLALQMVTRRQTTRAVWGFNGLALLLVVLTGVILASAFQRLALYEEAYGFTRLRTYSHVFMIWTGLLLGAFLVTVLMDRPRLFLLSALLAGLGFAATLDILNTDAFIAQQNIARYQQTGKLDAAYLASLSDDAVPYVLPLLDQVGKEDQQVIGGALHLRLNELEALNASTGWPGWHWARSHAYALLTEHRAQIEPYEPQRYVGDDP